MLLQRVKQASVEIESSLVSKIGHGLLLYFGCGKGDGIEQVNYLVKKVVELRVFPDECGKMNHSLREVEGEVLIISQFTLYGDCQKGRRPSFDRGLGERWGLIR